MGLQILSQVINSNLLPIEEIMKVKTAKTERKKSVCCSQIGTCRAYPTEDTHKNMFFFVVGPIEGGG